jgi:hypothetical protein
MNWNSIASLPSDRLVLLIFKGLIQGQGIGCLDEDGLCEWPDPVRGHRPTGWQDVTADLTRIKAIRF